MRRSNREPQKAHGEHSHVMPPKSVIFPPDTATSSLNLCRGANIINKKTLEGRKEKQRKLAHKTRFVNSKVKGHVDEAGETQT